MRIAFFLLVLAAVVIYAIYRGGTPERAVASVALLAVSLDPFVHSVTPVAYSKMDPGHLVIDVIVWGAFLWVALRANRFWPLCVVSLQTIALVAHIAKLMDVSIHPQAYFIMQVASSYPLLITLAIGTYCHQRRLKEHGTDPSWRSS
ncbi:MAG: hypothetical protein Pars2KO_00670 [Parasphingorhabdus sp.]